MARMEAMTPRAPSPSEGSQCDVVDDARASVEHHRAEIATTDPRFVSDEWHEILGVCDELLAEIARLRASLRERERRDEDDLFYVLGLAGVDQRATLDEAIVRAKDEAESFYEIMEDAGYVTIDVIQGRVVHQERAARTTQGGRDG